MIAISVILVLLLSAFGGMVLLAFSKVSSQLRIYSVGPDLQDNGGIAQSELPKGAPSGHGYDIVAAYPPIEPKAKP